jgi:hypothetical protein
MPAPGVKDTHPKGYSSESARHYWKVKYGSVRKYRHIPKRGYI